MVTDIKFQEACKTINRGRRAVAVVWQLCWDSSGPVVVRVVRVWIDGVAQHKSGVSALLKTTLGACAMSPHP